MTRLARRPALAALCALLLALGAGAAACGNGDDGAAEPADDRAAAQTAAQEYIDAFLAGDGERACGLLTDDVRRQFEEAAGVEECAPAFEQASGELDEQGRSLLGSAEVAITEVEGDTARGELRAGDQALTPLEMRRVGDRWLVATGPNP